VHKLKAVINKIPCLYSRTWFWNDFTSTTTGRPTAIYWYGAFLKSYKQSRLYAYNINLWRVRITMVAMTTQHCVLCVFWSYMSLSAIYKYCTKMLLLLIYIAGYNKTFLGLHVQCPIFLSDFKLIWIVLTDFHESQYKKFHWNLSSSSLLDECEQSNWETEG
jgi:hypothetical protein